MPFEVIVVVNEPRVAVPELPECRVVSAGSNLGYAGALVVGRTLTNADLIWVVQDDMTFGEETLAELLACMKRHPDVAVVAPVSVSKDSLTTSQARGGYVDSAGELSHVFPAGPTIVEAIAERPVANWLTLSGALIQTKAWDAIGGPDPCFFPLQYVDVDFGYRLTAAGYGLAISTQARIDHQLNGSSHGIMKRFLITEAKRSFAAKHGSSQVLDSRSLNRVEAIDVPLSLVHQIAKSASLGFVDLARFADKEVNLLLAELAVLNDGASDHNPEVSLATANHQLKLVAELQAMRNSWSWKITAPLRWILTRLHAFRRS